MRFKKNNKTHEFFPLTAEQEALWHVHNLSVDKCAFNINLAWEINSTFDSQLLKDSINAVVQKHPGLRTTIESNKRNQLFQTVKSHMPLDFEEIDCRGWTRKELNEVITEESYRSFDLEKGPVTRWILFCKASNHYILLFSMHHIFTDYGSVFLMMADLSNVYKKSTIENRMEKSRIVSFQDFVTHQTVRTNNSKEKRLAEFWNKKLKGKTGHLDLPLDKERPLVSNFRGSQYTLPVPPELSLKITEVSKRMGISRYTFFLTAYAILLHRYTSQENILISSPISKRTLKFKNVFGYFVNPVIMAAEFSESLTVSELLKKMHKMVVSGMINKDYPLAKLVDNLNLKRDISRSPVAQAAFNWIDYSSFRHESTMPVTVTKDGRVKWKIGGMQWEQVDLRGQTDDSDLVLEVFSSEGNSVIHWQYNDNIFFQSKMKNMAENFLVVLTNMIQSPLESIATLSILTVEEENKLLKCWNNSPVDFKKKECIHTWFEQQVIKTPDRTALVDGIKIISYGQLNQKANQVARYLLQKGDLSESVIGVCLDRNALTVISLMGILKSGAAYVPLDPQYPEERLNYIVKDACISTIITSSAYKDKWRSDKLNLICVDQIQKDLNSFEQDNPCVDVKLFNAAYIIYTSGSTGLPKGVVIEHQNVSALFNSYARVIPEYLLSGVLAATSFNFDPSIIDIFGTLGLGGTIILADNPLALPMLPAKDQVKMISAVPSTIKALIEMEGIPESVIAIGMGGEKLQQTLVKQIYALGHVQKVFNFYGPTEETVCATAGVVKPGHQNSPSLGRPLAKTEVYILDKNMQPVPVGVPGELYLSGHGLARGYLNQPKLTKERFIPHPFKNDRKLYKTGDLVKYLPNGDIDFMGRIDSQVKVRGFRIELEEIENVILEYPGIKESVVAIFKDAVGENLLHACIVKEKERAEISINDLSLYIKSKLPSHMVPSHITTIEKLPLNPNGKIDRKALPSPGRKNKGTVSSAQKRFKHNKTLNTIRSIWEDCLQLDEIDEQDNFFDLGGHSLLMVTVFSRLKKYFSKPFSLIDLYQYPTIESLSGFFNQESKNKKKTGYHQSKDNHLDNKIAVVGIACRFPGAANKDQFWENIKNGVESIREFSKEELLENGVLESMATHENYVPKSGWIDGIDMFDADFFNITPREAQIIDPQHRTFMECVWQAFEDAGIDPERTEATTGIYAGCGQNAYFVNNLSRHEKIRRQMGDYQLMIGNSNDFLSSRIGYKLNLKGPMANIQTACSTSMTGVHMACKGLLNSDCDIALAGGVSFGSLRKGYLYREGMILSSDGQCRPFDKDAKGTVPSQGVGVIVLKRLQDAIKDRSHIYAVIAGSAINNDGIGKAGFTAPSVSGQVNVIQAALRQARVNASQISYIEAHGTGTNVGDPIETAALETVFSPYHHEKSSCAVGALKANIGHTDVASGIAGIIKTALSIKNKMLPPSINYERPNGHIKFTKPFYVNTRLKPWDTDQFPRRAGVSAFGIGGCNAHTILEEYEKESSQEHRFSGCQLFVLSAKTPTALLRFAKKIKRHFIEHPEENLEKMAYTLQTGRQHFKYRTYFTATSSDEAIAKLSKFMMKGDHNKLKVKKNVPLTFMFTGQGSQYLNMGRDLYTSVPLFQKMVDNCLFHVSQIDSDLYNVLNKGENIWDTDSLYETSVTQPALFIFEYALATLLIDRGIKPDHMIGHSLGEYVAACVAGVFSLEDALKIVIRRGRLIQQLPKGEMISVGVEEETVRELITEELSLAAVNTPSRVVVSGSKKEIENFKIKCSNLDIPTINLKTSHAFHSKMLDSVLEDYFDFLNQIKMSPPQIPVISNVTGQKLSAGEACDPNYWVAQMRGTVLFSKGLETLYQIDSGMIFIEVGPGKILSSLAIQHPGRNKENSILYSARAPKEEADDYAVFLEALGALWKHHIEPDWGKFHNRRPGLIPLPTYPFERKKYWVDETLSCQSGKLQKDELKKRASLNKKHEEILLKADSNEKQNWNQTEKVIQEIWTDFLGIEEIELADDFFEIGGDSMLAVMMLDQIRDRFDIELSSNILMSCSTIKTLAEHIQNSVTSQNQISDIIHDNANGSPNYIVELKKGKIEPALFLCHPGAGHLYFYSDLLKYLDIPNAVYGVEAVGLKGNELPLNNIEQIAQHHVNQIRKIQKNGPYWIGGSSFGGMVAYETAQQLEKMGESVELLYMVDTPGPGHMVRPIKSNAQIIISLFSEIINHDHDLEKQLIELESEPERQIECVVKKARAENKAQLIPEGFGSHFIQMIRKHVNAMQNYSPKPYSGFFMFFRQTEQIEDYDPHPEMAWLPLAESGANVFTVPGNHYTMNASPNVKMIADEIMRYMNDKLKSDSGEKDGYKRKSTECRI